MARPREFDEQRAIESAMRAFWATGYAGTSTEDLCAATGLRRGSVYNTFGSKHELFEKALALYMRQRADQLAELFARELSGKEKLRILLWESLESDDNLGCLVVNTMIEMAPYDPAVAAMLRRDREKMVTVFSGIIEEGVRAGEIGNARAPLELADFLIGAINGMRVAMRAGAEPAAVESIARTALSVF